MAVAVKTNEVDDILQKAYNGERVTQEEGVRLFSADLLALGKVADERRKQRYKGREDVVTFAINRNLNYTNVCYVDCKFCAFYRHPSDKDTYLRSKKEIYKMIEELISIGGTEVLLQGGLNPKLGMDYYTDLFRSIHEKFPQIYIHSLSVAEIYHLVHKTGLPLREVLLQLQQAGLKSIPGAAEMLVDRIRKIVSPKKDTTQQWLDCMETAHGIGMQSTATMTFGMLETQAERVEHMQKIRELQDRTKGFRAFIGWTLSPYGTELSYVPVAGGVEYLKTVAVARIFLDNFPHITAGYVTEGMKVAQVALAFGCDDMGGTLMQEEVVAATGTGTPYSNVDNLIKTIRGAGKIPAQRDTEYNIIRTFD